jgi:hypothetical protein
MDLAECMATAVRMLDYWLGPDGKFTRGREFRVWCEFSETGFIMRFKVIGYLGNNFNFQYVIPLDLWRSTDSHGRAMFTEKAVNTFIDGLRGKGKQEFTKPKKGLDDASITIDSKVDGENQPKRTKAKTDCNPFRNGQERIPENPGTRPQDGETP